MLNKKLILNSNITNASQNELLDEIVKLSQAEESACVFFANVHMLIEAYQDIEFNNILSSAEIAVTDGKPLSVFMNVLYGTIQERIAGPDLMLALFRRAEQERISIYLYGSTLDILEAMRKKLAEEYPFLPLAGMHSPPFRRLSEAEDQEITELIIQSGAQIILVALGCPKQEKWMHEHRDKIRGVMLGVGAAFPFYTGHLKRCPRWMQKMSLEWFFRFLIEPKRLFKRYFSTNLLFLFLIFKQLMHKTCKPLTFR